MAIVKGKPGRYAANKVSKARWVQILSVYFGSFLVGVFGGFAVADRSWLAVAALAPEIVLLLLGKHFLAGLEKDMESWKKGEDGEAAVARELEKELPKTYHVINDINTGFGNLDHVVVGPTGVFAVETKNWKGNVTSDGRGELLLNGKPTHRPHVRNFTRTIMSTKERWAALAQTDRFIRGVMVFPSAYEKVKWGTTGNIQCISIKRIPDYFLKNKVKEPLSTKEVDKLSHAFLQLARMDKDFTE